MRRAILTAALTLLTLPTHAASPRTIQPFTENWRFTQSDPAEAKSPAFDDTAWQTVTLPHDWSVAGPVKEDAPSKGAGGYFPTGTAWYRKILTIPKLDPARRTWIAFDGIMANSDVYLNGQLLGHRPYGYVSFHYDLTPHLHAGKNIIAVRTDNSQQPASRWYPGAGINRQVRLITTSAIHIAPWSTFVTTPKVTAKAATIHVRTTVTNDSNAAATVTLTVALTSPRGAHSSIPGSKPISIAPHATQDLDSETTIANPDRWDLDHAALYTASATISSNNPIDEESIPFGIREVHFDPNLGFFLNGTHHKLYGVAIHTDAGALGTAVPLAAWTRRLNALRVLGVNAIRTAHNPPDPAFLDLCDRLGFLVMDEMFDAWTVAKNPYDYHLYFKDWSIRDTADTVMRDRNHPSIILYSAGNEIHDTPKPDLAIPILKSLVATFHQYDPTRPVTQGLFRPNVSHDYDNGLADLLDVVGQNYREQEILKAHADKPTRAIVGTENGHGRDQWVALRDHPEYAGQFLWTGIDYLGEAGPWPAIGSGSGLLLTTALPRARGYERQAWWAPFPVVHLARRVAIAQKAPTDPGYEAPNAPAPTRFTQPLVLDWTPADTAPHTETVEIYTNAEEVELFLNDKSQGKQARHPDATPITFQVPYAPGILKATARTAGKAVAADTLRTAGKPTNLILTPTLAPLDAYAQAPPRTLTPILSNDWNDVTYATAILTDANGTTVPDNATVIHFTTRGPATIVAVDNGNLLDHDPFQATQRKLYEGKAVAILRATAPTGAITVTATAEGIKPATLTLKAAPAAPTTTQRSF